MIKSFRHKGLKLLYEDDDPRGVISEHLAKSRNILARLDASQSREDMNLPGFELHALKLQLQGSWAVTVRANWRVIFHFVEGHASEVDYLDYH